jgi:hypothetical protein
MEKRKSIVISSIPAEHELTGEYRWNEKGAFRLPFIYTYILSITFIYI